MPEQFWGNEGAGALIVAKDTGRILLFLRSDNVNEPNTWNVVGGKIDYGEDPKQAVKREMQEETGFEDDLWMSLIYTFKYKNFQYYNYLVVVPFEFTPELNWEHDNAQWFEFGDWPSPLHFGLNDLLKHSSSRIKRLVDAIKKRNEKYKLGEVMDAPPPAIVQKAEQPKPSAMDAKKLENAYVAAATLWGEARGEGIQGMQGVMNVIMNRAKGNFDKVGDIALKPKQFSMWNSISDPVQYAMELGRAEANNTHYRSALELVSRAMQGRLPDVTAGAQFYFNPKKANPSWSNKMEKTVTIGNHEFYKLPPKRLATK